MDETILSFIGLILDYLVPDKELPTSLNGFSSTKTRLSWSYLQKLERINAFCL
jgi:hypothetical protein